MSSKGGDKDQPQVPGYTTKDDAGEDGDDTIHQPIKFYNVPNCIGSNVSFPAPEYAAAYGPVGFRPVHISTPDKVDIIYNEFIENWVLLALQYLGEPREKKDTGTILDGKTMTDVISDWIKKSPQWACEKKDKDV